MLQINLSAPLTFSVVNMCLPNFYLFIFCVCFASKFQSSPSSDLCTFSLFFFEISASCCVCANFRAFTSESLLPFVLCPPVLRPRAAVILDFRREPVSVDPAIYEKDSKEFVWQGSIYPASSFLRVIFFETKLRYFCVKILFGGLFSFLVKLSCFLQKGSATVGFANLGRLSGIAVTKGLRMALNDRYFCLHFPAGAFGHLVFPFGKAQVCICIEAKSFSNHCFSIKTQWKLINSNTYFCSCSPLSVSGPSLGAPIVPESFTILRQEYEWVSEIAWILSLEIWSLLVHVNLASNDAK